MHTQVALHVTGQLFMNKLDKGNRHFAACRLHGPKLQCWQLSERCTGTKEKKADISVKPPQSSHPLLIKQPVIKVLK